MGTTVKNNYLQFLALLNLVNFEDFKQCIAWWVYASDLPFRQKDMVLDYFFRNTKSSFRSVGLKHNVSTERVRQIIYGGIRKLRHPKRINILTVGLRECKKCGF